MSKTELYKSILETMQKGEIAALATVIETKGSAPGKPGFKMLVKDRGEIVGTVGGGLVEKCVMEEALRVMEKKSPKVFNYKLDREAARGLGMLCGGEVTLFIEPIAPSEIILIFGAGHIAMPLAEMAVMLGFKVVVVDDREEFCSSDRFPGVEQCLVGNIEEVAKKVKVTCNTYIVIVTRGHEHDEMTLRKVIHSGAAYIGMIGSKKKINTIFQNLSNSGISEETLKRVYAPIGLDIKAKTPEEIALSILAEIIAVKNQRE